MGKLIYGSSEFEFDDRTLLHLQTVIGAKVRRNEGLFFTWLVGSPSGGGRVSVWLHPAIPLQFRYYGSRPVLLNKEWIDELTVSSNSNRGLSVSVEPLPDNRWGMIVPPIAG